jgi:hypothetical protein
MVVHDGRYTFSVAWGSASDAAATATHAIRDDTMPFIVVVTIWFGREDGRRGERERKRDSKVEKMRERR